MGCRFRKSRDPARGARETGRVGRPGRAGGGVVECGRVSATAEDPGPQATPPWAFLAVALIASAALALGLAGELDRNAPPWRVALGLAPAFAAVLALFHRGVIGALRALGHRRVAAIAAGLVVWTFLVPASRFDPYWAVLLALWAAAPILALRHEPDPGRLTALGLLAWLVWWIPFDLRWFKDLWLGPGGASYAATSLLVTALAGATFGALSRQGGPELRAPTGRDVGVGLGALVAFGLVAIPVGLGLGFLKTSAPSLDAGKALLVGFGLAFTVALPEELFFRGVLDAGLRSWFRREWASLAVSSVAFGLMHWNNRDDLKAQLAYLLLASVAGVFYGLAYRRGGLWAAVITHTLVDLAWQVFLRGK